MIWNIALKDFHNNLRTARFVIGFLLCLFLIPFTMLVSINDYQSQVSAYQIEKKNAEESLKVRVYSNLRPDLVKPPTPLSIFSRGISYNVGNKVKTWISTKSLFAEGRVSTRENPFMNAFFSIDFMTIMALIMSLLALLFTYDVCSDEREQGTLRMIFSNSINRWKVLSGKTIGVLLTLLPTILFSFLLSILIILIHPAVAFGVSEWISVAVLFILSIVFFGFFISLGLLISSRVRSSATSIIICLFLWASMVYIIPNLANVSASSLVKTESRDNLEDQLDELNREFFTKVDDYKKSHPKPIGGFWGFQDGGRDGYQHFAGASGETHEYYRIMHQYTEPLRLELANNKWVYQKAFLDKLDRQRKLAELLSFLSPSEIFRLTASALSGTDAAAQYHFLNQCRLYREELIRFFQDKKIFSSYSYFTNVPPEKFMTIDEIIAYVTEGRFQTLEQLYMVLQQQPNTSIMQFYKRSAPHWDREYYPFINLATVPKFNYIFHSLNKGIINSFNKIAFLIIVSVLMFFLTYISFIKYDVR